MHYVTACIVLHNLMINVQFDEIWIDEEFASLADDDELNSSINTAIDGPGDLRRRQLLAYFAELNISSIM